MTKEISKAEEIASGYTDCDVTTVGLLAIIKESLDLAAQQCDEVAKKYIEQQRMGAAVGAGRCAIMIRAMKSGQP